MKREKNTRVLSIVALIIAVIGLTVAFAAMSTTLRINGTAKVKSSSWDIHFANLNLIKQGMSEANDLENPITGSEQLVTMSATNISGIQAILKEPGDKVIYSFDIVNSGDIDAKLSNLTKSENLTCKYANSEKPADEVLNEFCQNINYTLTYGSTDSKTNVSELDNNLDLIKSDDIDSNDSIRMYLTIEYSQDSGVIPSDDIILSDSGKSDITVEMIYSQK